MFLRARAKQLLVGTFIAVTWLAVLPAQADDNTAAPALGPTSVSDTTAEGYLALIAQYTNGTLAAVNNIPQYLLTITESMVMLMGADSTKTTANLQGAFTSYYTSLANSASVQPTLAQQMTADILSNANTGTLPNANDITYQTVLGTKFFTPDPRDTGSGTPVDSTYNYIKNASGGSLVHALPNQASWTGSTSDQTKYANYYNTTMAITTYDAYVLSQLFTDSAAGVSANQTTLSNLANGSDYFAQIASEAIGVVLRQILMFQSQSYILQTEILNTQKQMLAAQAMANTLMINNATVTEGMLVHKAVVQTQAM